MVALNAKIKIRRGKKDDLVDLSEAEFGFTNDTGELFIGAPDLPSLQGKGRGEPNEQFPYKNVQLLTTGSPLAYIQYYTYRGNGPDEAQTGPSASAPVVRTYQNKFDDLVNFADFIYNADANADKTEDLNRMLQQIYNDMDQTERKTCHLSAGLFVINKTVKVPPYTVLKGEGMDRTMLQHNDPNPSSISTMFETVDNLFQEGTQIGTNGASLAGNIEIMDMTIKVDNPIDFFRAYRASNVTFTRVKFVGPGFSSSGKNVLYVDRLGSIIEMERFEFDNCRFEGISNVVSPIFQDTNAVKDIFFSRCKFKEVYKVMDVDNDNVYNIIVAGNHFYDITTTLFNIKKATNFSSMNNTYEDKGAVSPNYPIVLGEETVKCSSVNDAFFGISVMNGADDFIYISKNAAVYEYQGFMQSGRRIEMIDPGKIDGVIAIPFAMEDYDIVRIQYNIRRGTIQRSGEVTLTHDYTNAIIYDNYNENGDIGVTFNAVTGVFNGKASMILQYESTPGMQARISYQYSAVKGF